MNKKFNPIEDEALSFPNLDDIDASDLELWCEVFGMLREYAYKKGYAMNARKKGTGGVMLAQLAESEADEIYNRLPRCARW